MARAFTDVSELHLLAEQFATGAAGVDQRAQEFLHQEAGPDLVARMRAEVPRDSDETHDSIEDQYDDRGVSVGPTNVDEQGRPIGFFIEHGTSDTDPDPFALRTAVWAEKVMPDRAAEYLRDLL